MKRGCEEGREGGRERGKEGEKEEGRKGGREGDREHGRPRKGFYEMMSSGLDFRVQGSGFRV
jgi:hypothetical protein